MDLDLAVFTFIHNTIQIKLTPYINLLNYPLKYATIHPTLFAIFEVRMSENSTNKQFRLITRSDFDGLLCAVILKDIGIIDTILFVHSKDM